MSRNQRLLFYTAWLGLTLLQASLTELQDDEAYYWIFSKFLAWGYFDHPPMTALFIKAGYGFFHNELGVRILFVLVNTGSLLLIEKLIEKKNSYLFFAIMLSIAAFQLSGFLAVPDTLLIFFTALFFLAYRNFTRQDSWKNSILLSIAITLLFYTKYHALLIVCFTFLSNPVLLKKPKFYCSILLVILLYLPHIFWQYQHDFISIRYHLFESNVDPYKFSYTTNYLLGQLLLAGPIAGLFLLPAALSYRTTNKTERAMKWTMVGFYIFFLLSSLRGKVEPNWTSPALVPLVVLAYNGLRARPKLLKALVYSLPLTILLVLFARIVMIKDIIPVHAIRERYHAWKQWPATMRARTQNLPIVFSNSYQRASKYWFYSGQMTFSQNHVRDHRNNYDLWPIEQQMLGKPVYFLDIYGLDRFNDSLKTPIGTIGYRRDSSFSSYSAVQFIPAQLYYDLTPGNSITIEGSIKMPPAYRSFIAANPALQATVQVEFFDHKKIIKEIVTAMHPSDLLKAHFSITCLPGLPPGNYQMMVAIQVPGYNPTHNSERMFLKMLH